MPRRRGKKPPSRRRPSPEFVRELNGRATNAESDELELWLRDVRPAVRHAARQELERRGVRVAPDTLPV